MTTGIILAFYVSHVRNYEVYEVCAAVDINLAFEFFFSRVNEVEFKVLGKQQDGNHNFFIGPFVGVRFFVRNSKPEQTQVRRYCIHRRQALSLYEILQGHGADKHRV